MAATDRPPRRLIVNADDFGRSADINAAVIAAHEQGILTTASLMVNEPAAAAAVELARLHPRLGVGLHLVLACGRATPGIPATPGLVSPDGRFPDSAPAAGLRYFLRRDLRATLRREVAAQFDAFARTGLPLDHVNGHLNIHLHPTILRLVLDLAPPARPQRLRLTRDPFLLNARLARGAWLYRCSHALIFALLSAWAAPRLRRQGWRHTRAVFGLLQNARVDETFVTALLPRLPDGDSELYSHPSLTEFRHEFEALVSPRVREQVTREGLRLIRYQDL